jgi:hypothetical protein
MGLWFGGLFNGGLEGTWSLQIGLESSLDHESYDVGRLRRLPFWETRTCACECVREYDSKDIILQAQDTRLLAFLRDIYGLNAAEKDAQLDARSVTTSLHFLLRSADTQTQTLDYSGDQLLVSDNTQHGILESRDTGGFDLIPGLPSSGSDEKCFATMAEDKITGHFAC